jgi:RNA polymerase sigma factor (sigma-70 family)
MESSLAGAIIGRMSEQVAPPTLVAALRSYFRKRVPGQEVEDLVQEVLANLEGRQSSKPIDDFERYVFVVAANTLKRRLKDPNYSHMQLPENWDAGSDITPERILASKDGLARVLEVIAALPPKTRNVFMLHRFEEMTYRAIGSGLGISVSSVEKHIIAALKAVRDAVGSEP